MIPKSADTLISLALKEDLGFRGDVTTECFVPRSLRLEGVIIAKQAGVVCGTEIAARVFKRVDRGVKISIVKKDGSKVKPGDVVMKLSGSRAILTAERTALNFLQRMSGVASLTAVYAAKLKGTRAKVFDTRKTLPGWRELDKYAVKCGGGMNHRMGLYDAVMAKDNHWAGSRDMEACVRAAREKYPNVLIELEADTLDQVALALVAKADVILLDNMDRAALKRGIELIRRAAPRTHIEVSGGVTLKTIRSIGQLGPDRISVGRLTHSAPALDLSLDIGK